MLGQRLVRVAKSPRRQCRIGMTIHARITAIQDRVTSVLLGVVELHALLQVQTGSQEITQKEQRHPQGALRFQEQRRVWRAFRQVKKLSP